MILVFVPDVLVAPLWISVCDSLSQLQHAALSMPLSGEETLHVTSVINSAA